ncbi:hypothetical protein R6Q57_024974, partial [Mikania cordata]
MLKFLQLSVNSSSIYAWLPKCCDCLTFHTQSTSGTKAKEDLAAATHAVEELMYMVRYFKTKAEQSETMVQEICRDIKKLDCAKKHITTTITAIYRLTMLVSAIEQLQAKASKRKYKEAAAQLEAVNQLCIHFDAYRDIPKITELRDKFKNIKQILKSHVFSDFSSLGTGKEAEESNLLQQLSDACLVVDALEPSVREELVKNFCNRELISYQQIFEGAELAKLDKTERRYAWVKRRLRTNKEIWKTFPASWHVDYLLCIQFCKLTRTQLLEIFQNPKEKPDVGTLLLLLQFNFRGIISSCFEPHMMIYVELEERTITEHLEKLVQDEAWGIDDGSQTNILSSSMQVFQRVLRAYATKLLMKLPKGGMGIVAAATGIDGHIKTSDKDERLICYIVNTAEYCHKTAGELAENVSKIIDSHLIHAVNMSEVQDEFSSIITKALVTLLHGVETKVDIEMAAMTRVPWGMLESVGDQSEYVNNLNIILTGSVPTLGSLLSPVYFQFFLDKMLLDTQAVKTILLDIPTLGRQTSGAAGYAKFVSREMSKAEALLKVILSPIDSVADTCGALLPEGTPSEFQRILELKGLKKADHQAILEDFNKRGFGREVEVTPPMSTTPSAGVREDVLTRAAALG